MPEFRRPHHKVIASILKRLNAQVLAEAQCFFGGGTQLAMAFGEYRESRDIDFLCSNREGFRLLREEVTQNSLGSILARPMTLARDVRADRDGIRTFFETKGAHIKFAMILEARIELSGDFDKGLGVPALNVEIAIAEKLMANADRGRDQSTLSRDLIDLAFVTAQSDKSRFREGFAVAEQAYGSAVERELRAALDTFSKDRARANACLKSLAIDDVATLRKGMRALRTAIR